MDKCKHCEKKYHINSVRNSEGAAECPLLRRENPLKCNTSTSVTMLMQLNPTLLRKFIFMRTVKQSGTFYVTRNKIIVTSISVTIK